MIVILDRKTLESALVNMPFARCVVKSMISHRVNQGDPTHENLATLARSNLTCS